MALNRPASMSDVSPSLGLNGDDADNLISADIDPQGNCQGVGQLLRIGPKRLTKAGQHDEGGRHVTFQYWLCHFP
jgi:hypothetical protein